MPKPLCLVDTSILLNILNVPGKNEHRDEVFAAFREKVDAGETFFLPLATIIETGNHIGHLPDGNDRYGYACALVQQVKMALGGHIALRAAGPVQHGGFAAMDERLPAWTCRAGAGRR